MVLARRDLLAFAVISIAACGDRAFRSGQVQDSTSSMLQLMARMFTEPHRITIEYEVYNSSDRPAFLFDILHHEFENDVYPLDSGAYVEVLGRQVRVSRKMFPVPAGLLVEKRNIPFSTRLLPNERKSERIVLKLPLVPRNPYRDKALGNLIEECEVIFEIGYFFGQEGTEALGRMFKTDRGEVPGFEAFGENQQQLLSSNSMGRTLAAL